MSKIDLIVKNPAKIVDVLASYQTEIDELEGRLAIRGKTLEYANQEQAGWYVYYDERKVELKTLTKYFQMRVDKVRSQLMRRIIDNSARSYSDRQIDKIIDSEDEFLSMQELMLEVEEMYEKYAAIVEAYKARGFALRNKLRRVSIKYTDKFYDATTV